MWCISVVFLEIEFEQDAYDEMIVTYETTAEKDWIAVTVTIDGRWIRVGHHDETGWRAACGFLARRVVNEE